MTNQLTQNTYYLRLQLTQRMHYLGSQLAQKTQTKESTWGAPDGSEGELVGQVCVDGQEGAE